MKSKCIVCRKAKAEVFRVCKHCARAHDSTTGDRISTGPTLRKD